jgi:hypothetical protein
MEVIKDTVKNVMQIWEAKRGKAPKDDPRAILKRIFNKKELGHIKFNYFKKGALSINVDSSAWLYHFSLKKGPLLEKIQKRNQAVKDIRFFIGETG